AAVNPLGQNTWYQYQVSLLNGDVNLALPSTVSPSDIEVGTGGTATVKGGTNGALYVWEQKKIRWTSQGAGHGLVFPPFTGIVPNAPGILTLNLLSGVGVNPWGGTLNVRNVDKVTVGSVGGEYIVCNNDGDTINGFGGTFGFGGNALIVGGTGNDN